MRATLVLFVAALGLPSLTAADVVVPIDSVQHFVNIRAEANADSDVIGRLYQGDSMPLVQSIDGWHEIEIEPDLDFVPAVHSAILAADAIAVNSEYDLKRLAHFSIPGFFRNRGEQARLSAIGDRESVSLP